MATRRELVQPLQLCLLAFVNYGLFYGLTVFLARTLDIKGFEIYNVAVATVMLLASLTTFGLEKYALRALTALFEKQNWDHARGYIWFSGWTILITSVAVGGLYSLVRYSTTVGSNRELWSVLIAVAFLPAAAMAQFFIELLAASGRVVRATFAYRLLLPVSIVLFVLVASRFAGGMTARLAVLGYGLGWLLIAMALYRWARHSVPAEIWTAAKTVELRAWLGRAAPFLVHSVMMTQFASLGIIGLEFAGRGERSVGLLAACMQSGSFIVLLATATNRYYSPRLSVMIERQDYQALAQGIRERLSWVGPVTLVYFLVMVLFGDEILGLYGPDFKQGHIALIWIAGGASIGVLFAMAPNYLKFIRRNDLVLGITVVGAIMNLGLILLLGPSHGATGAAIAYAVSLSGMSLGYVIFGLLSVRKRLKRT